MYEKSDPRAAIAAAAKSTTPPATEFAGAEYEKFYETAPRDDDASGLSWYARGQNFIVAYSRAAPGGTFSRTGQVDEYAVLVPDTDTAVEIEAGGETVSVPGYSLAFVPPGDSRVTVGPGGTIVRLFTTRSEDLAAKCGNAESYREPHPNIPPFEPWPAPEGGYRIRSYSLDVTKAEGRFGRIFRCTTLMVNVLDPGEGPRDITALSPHFHDDFEQCSLVLEGTFTHHIRWPWTANKNVWRDDDHELCGAPSVTVIPPPSIHTSRGMDPGINQLVDIFSPPRHDFSKQPGWVLNADDYSAPAPAAPPQ